jgi:cytochrome c
MTRSVARPFARWLLACGLCACSESHAGDEAGRPSAGGGDAGAESRAGAGGSASGGAGSSEISLLVFSRTAAFRHDSIPAGVQALKQLAAKREWSLTSTEDPTAFDDAGLAAYDVAIFLSTTGDVLNDAQQAAFERFIRAGKGFVGIHSASDTEYDWPWYGELVGAYFREHPAVERADVVVEDATHLATLGLPNPWSRTDEWYAFESNPRGRVHVLLSLDEASYSPLAANMGSDHPVAWYREYDGGRTFYTALGHTVESYADPLFIGHLAGAIEWAARH